MLVHDGYSQAPYQVALTFLDGEGTVTVESLVQDHNKTDDFRLNCRTEMLRTKSNYLQDTTPPIPRKDDKFLTVLVLKI